MLREGERQQGGAQRPVPSTWGPKPRASCDASPFGFSGRASRSSTRSPGPRASSAGVPGQPEHGSRAPADANWTLQVTLEGQKLVQNPDIPQGPTKSSPLGWCIARVLRRKTVVQKSLEHRTLRASKKARAMELSWVALALYTGWEMGVGRSLPCVRCLTNNF